MTHGLLKFLQVELYPRSLVCYQLLTSSHEVTIIDKQTHSFVWIHAVFKFVVHISSTFTGSAPTPMPSKAHIPVRLTSSPLITSKQAQQSTRTDGIYEEPCRTHQVADNKEKDLRVTSHYYSAVQGGSPVQLRPPTSPKPKPKRRATMAGKI